MADHLKAGSVFDQIDDYENDMALLKPILKEAREDRDEIKRLREALKPFADAAENLEDTHHDGAPIWESAAAMSIAAGDLRTAAKLLNG